MAPVPNIVNFGLINPHWRTYIDYLKKKSIDIKSYFEELTKDEMGKSRQRLAGLKHDARQPRVATEEYVPNDKKTRKRMEDAAVNQAKHGDRCSAKRVHADPTSSTGFGMTAKPPALSRRDDILVNKGVEAPKPHLPPVEVRMLPSAAGGLLPAGTAPTALRTIFRRLLLF